MKLEVPVPFSAYRDNHNKEKFLEILKKYRENISCIYLLIGYIAKDTCSFGIRNVHVEGGVTEDSIEDFHEILFEETDIPVKILCNDLYSGVLHNNINQLLQKINLYKSRCFLKSIVIADFFLAKNLAKENIPICLSVNATNGLNSLSHALLHNKENHITEVVFSRELNRNINKVHEFIKNHHTYMIGIEFILMVNEGCAPFCPYKHSGDIEIMLDNSIELQNINIHTHGCAAIREENPWLFLASPFLSYRMLQRPEFKDFTFKIAGRNLESNAIGKILDHYINGTNLKLSELNNIQQLAEINTSQLTHKFEDTVLSCDKQCILTYCDKIQKTNHNNFMHRTGEHARFSEFIPSQLLRSKLVANATASR